MHAVLIPKVFPSLFHNSICTHLCRRNAENYHMQLQWKRTLCQDGGVLIAVTWDVYGVQLNQPGAYLALHAVSLATRRVSKGLAAHTRILTILKVAFFLLLLFLRLGVGHKIWNYGWYHSEAACASSL